MDIYLHPIFFMPYTNTREEASELLGISTRTLDRYVKNGKIRSRRIGKMIYLHSEDIAAYRNGEPELIRPSDSIRIEKRERDVNSSEWVGNDEAEVIIYDDVQNFKRSKRDNAPSYRDLYEESLVRISEKDKVIQELSYRAGHAESELKNSVSMIEYKKQTFLLESARARTDDDIRVAEAKSVKLEQDLMKSQFSLYMLVTLVALLLVVSSVFLYFLI